MINVQLPSDLRIEVLLTRVLVYLCTCVPNSFAFCPSFGPTRINRLELKYTSTPGPTQYFLRLALEMYKQSRKACDRCHDLKLRCHRNESGQCSRCARAGANCLFSPSNRGRRPNHQDRRNGSHISKWTSNRPLAMGLTSQMPYSPNAHLEDIDLLNRLSTPDPLEHTESDL